MKTHKEKIVEVLNNKLPSFPLKWEYLNSIATTILEQLEPEGKDYCKCKSANATNRICNRCKKETPSYIPPQQPSEGEIEKVWYKYAGVERGFIKWEDKREVLNVMSRDRFDAAIKELLNR